MYKEQQVAESKYGVAKDKPQFNDLEFLKHLRRINLNAFGCWIHTPEATIEIKEAVRTWKVPKEVLSFPQKDSTWLTNVKAQIELVEDEDCFKMMMMKLKKEPIIALDYEHHTKHSYNGLVALIQIASCETTYIIDPFKLRKKILDELCPLILSNPKVIKIVCGGDNDILFTQSNFDCFLQGVIDVQLLYNIYKDTSPDDCFNVMNNYFFYHLAEQKKKNKGGREITEKVVREAWTKPDKISYAKLVGAFFWEQNIVLNKDAQHADFRQRPLSTLGPLIEYAAADVHYLIRIYELLRAKVSLDNLKRAFEESNQALKKTFAGTKYPTVDQLIKKKRVSFSNDDVHGLEAFRRLHRWRDGYAKLVDESPEILLPLSGMLDLVKKRNTMTTMDHLSQFLKKFKSLNGNQTLHVYAAIKDDTDLINRMENVRCHNCEGRGHCGWACPHPSDRDSWNRFTARPENKIFKDRQSYRRAYNWYNKTGVWPPTAPKPADLPIPKCLQ